MVCFPREGDLEVFLEVDRRARGLGGLLEEMMNRDESRLHFTVQPADLPELEQQLRQVIDQYS
ncbi:MAG: hypothetical protein R3310_07770 [Candidatus Competibacteraceae bacterium]|nr:hypothetical protein [Candidatus Competibacteraceae bacterium]